MNTSTGADNAYKIKRVSPHVTIKMWHVKNCFFASIGNGDYMITYCHQICPLVTAENRISIKFVATNITFDKKLVVLELLDT